MGFIVGVLSIFGGGGGLAGIFGGGIFGKIFGKIISFAFSSLMGGAKKPSSPGLKDRGLTTMIKQAIVERDIVYGRVKKSGTVVYLQTEGEENKYAHMVIALASHECEEIESLYVEEIEAEWDQTTGKITNDEYKHDGNYYIQAWAKLGAPGQTAIPELIDATSDEGDTAWTANHTMAGMCYIYVKLRWNSSVWTQLPNISVVMKGKNDILDPRTGQRGYTDNAALCILDYLSANYQSDSGLETPIGVGITTDEYDDTAWGVEADICDELVPIAEGGSEKRFTCNGVVNTLDEQSTILDELLTSCAGKITYRGGQYYLLTAVYRPPSVTLTQEDILSDITIPVKLSRADVFNGVKGLYISEKNDWQASDFPAVKSDVFKAEDGGERIWQDIELSYTSSPSTAQRISKILLFSMRQQISVNFVASLNAFQLVVGDTVNITDEDMGWENKPFEVVSWDLLNDLKTGISVDLGLRETAPAVFEWSTDEESIVDDAPNTNFPDISAVTNPQNATAESGTDQLLIDGSTIISRILVSWDSTQNAFVDDGGQIEIQFKKSSDEVWEASNAGFIAGNATSTYISPVEDGTDYDIRGRFRNFIGAYSEWTYIYNHTVVGKSAPPANVQNFRADQNGAFVTLEWDEVSDIDLDSYQLRIGTQGDTSWDNARVLVERIKANSWSTSVLPVGNHTVFIKAKDSTGNFSAQKASRTFTVAPSNYTVDSSLNLAENGWTGTLENMIINGSSNTISPDTLTDADVGDSNADAVYKSPASFTWPEIDLGSDQDIRVWANLNLKKVADTIIPIQPDLYIKTRSASDPSAATLLENASIISSQGTPNNMVIHHTGKLVPESTDLASVDGIFDEAIQNQNTSTYYTSPEYDIGFDSLVNLEVETSESLAPGEVSGTANVEVELSYKLDGGSYTSFTSFSGGTFEARYFKIRLITEGTSGKTVINSATLDIDNFKRFTGVGEFQDKRYVQIKLVIDSSKGIAYCKDYNITIDSI